MSIKLQIGRPNIADAPPWYPYFFDLAPGDDLIKALQDNNLQVQELIKSVPAELEDYRYAPEKWTIKQVFIHLADDERYYAYKSFCLSRRSDVNLEIPQGKAYNIDFNAQNRTLQDIEEDLLAVREATITLFSTMTDEMLDWKDFPHEIPYTARSLGWMAVGHSIHHCRMIHEQYLKR